MSGELILAFIGIAAAGITSVLACIMPIYLSRKKTLLQHKINAYIKFLDFSNTVLAEFFKRAKEPIPFSMDDSYKIRALATQVSLFSDEKIMREVDEFIEVVRDYEVNSAFVAVYNLPVIYDEQPNEKSVEELLKRKEKYEKRALIAITEVGKQLKSITLSLHKDLYGKGKKI